MNRIDLQGRIAVVTGGASGIGAAVCERLAASGARVAVWDLDLDAAQRVADRLAPAGSDADQHTPHAAMGVNVTNPDGVDRCAADVLARFGRLDILVCSAGITGPNASTWDYPVDDWKRVLDVNLHGTFLCNRAVVPRMLVNNHGRIINIASIAGKEGNPNASAYSASKAAVIALTKSLGKELARTGVRANCIAPAAVRTPLFEQMTPQHVEFMLSKIPMGRFGQLEEVAAMVAWLASDECSFSTGAVFDLSGGRAVY